MTTTADPGSPSLDMIRGTYGGGGRSTYVRNLLARANRNGTAEELTHEIIRKMRRHYQISSCLLVQSLPLIRADWTIECEDEDHAERLSQAYDTISFHVHKSMAKALPDGYSANELVWTYRADLNLIAVTEVRDYEARTCEPVVDDTGALDGFDQTLNGQKAQIEAWATLWVVEGMESGNYRGRSVLDAALQPWQSFAAIDAFHDRYLERFGEPTVLMRAPQGTSFVNAAEVQAAVIANEGLQPGDDGYVVPPEPIIENNLDAAMDVGKNLRHHSVVALPSSLVYGTDGKPAGYAWQLEFVESAGGKGGDFLEKLREIDKRIARAIFVPDLLIGNGDTGGSVANALGSTHRDMWQDSVEGRLDDFSRQITAQIIEPMRRENFGEDSPPARLVFSPLTDEGLDRAWALVQALANGETIDVRALAESLDLPLADEAEEEPEPTPEPDPEVDEELRARDTATPLATQALPATFLAADVDNLPEWRLPQSYDPPAWARALNSREKRVGFARLESALNQAEAGTIAALEEILDTEHDRILRQLTAVVKKGSPREVIEAISTLTIKAEPKVARAWADLMSDVAAVVLEQLRGELEAYASTLPTSVGPAARAMFAAYAQTAAERVVTSLLTDTRLRLLNAYTSGVTSRPGLASIVGQVFDTYSSSEGKPMRLTTRMLSAKSMNYSRANAVEAAGIPLAGAQYSAILDRRTCELCKRLDEKVIAIEHTDLARFTPPVHHNCRCVWVWITRDEADFTPTWTTPSKSDVDRYGGLVIG